MTSSYPPNRPDAACGKARDWYPYLDSEGQDRVTPEIVASIAPNGIDALTQSEKEIRIGEFQALIRSAAQGALGDGSWKPVTRDPTLWELRWSWDDGSLHRGYFHEPSVEPDSTVLAKVHAKEIVNGDDAATNRLQDARIDEARSRVAFGRAHRWGLRDAKKLN